MRKESQALKRIRDSMGSEDFPRLVFEKVFKEDIDRLLSMDDMWKGKKKPTALDYDTLSKEALGVGSAVAQQDQIEWTPAENFAVFLDSLRRLSNRMEETRATQATGNSPPILTFDKDDEDTLDFVAASANLRSIVFDIEQKSKFDIKRMCSHFSFEIPADYFRNGWKHYTCDRHHKCHDSFSLCVAGFQSLTQRAPQGEDGLPGTQWHRTAPDIGSTVTP